MCGLVGVLALHSAPCVSVLHQMLDTIQHRGPDDRGLFTSETVGLGHVRLSILDLSSRGHQPMYSHDRRSVIAYNGEIYNFRELREELGAVGVRMKTGTDTEVVLQAISLWGPEQAVKRFNGMFAFAYYDRDKRALWLARDRLGIKPLYVARTPDAVLFASEAKALFEDPRVRCLPDMHAVATQLLYQRLDGRRTPFEGIEAVPPGTLIKIGDSEEETVFFDVLRDVDPRRIVESAGVPFSEHFKQFKALFEDSVEKHLVSDAPLATMCSGGLDSSLITAVTRRHKPDIVSYVVDFEGVSVSEAARAKIVCEHLDVDLRTVKVTQDDFFQMWPEAVLAYDRPNHAPQNVGAMAVARAIRRDGFKVVLSGDGADELFGGYRWYVETFKHFRRQRLQSQFIPDTRWTRFIGRYIPTLAPLNLEDINQYPFMDFRASPGFTGWQATVLDGMQRQLRQRALFEKLAPVVPLEERALLARSFEDIYIHMSEALRGKDRMTMWNSVECRVPFIETQLIDLALHLPCSAKYADGLTKRLVSQLSEELLPPEIVRLPKIGFDVPSSLWRGLGAFLRDGQVAGMLKWGRVDQERIIHELVGHPDALFRMLTTEIWARSFFEHETPEQLSEALLRINKDHIAE